MEKKLLKALKQIIQASNDGVKAEKLALIAEQGIREMLKEPRKT